MLLSRGGWAGAVVAASPGAPVKHVRRKSAGTSCATNAALSSKITPRRDRSLGTLGILPISLESAAPSQRAVSRGRDERIAATTFRGVLDLVPGGRRRAGTTRCTRWKGGGGPGCVSEERVVSSSERRHNRRSLPGDCAGLDDDQVEPRTVGWGECGGGVRREGRTWGWERSGKSGATRCTRWKGRVCQLKSAYCSHS